MSKRNIKTNSKFDYIDILLFIAPFLIGLSPIWSLALFAMLCIGGIIYKIIKNDKLILPKGMNLIFLVIYLLGFLIAEFVAVDKGMNILGFFKNLTILLFVVLYLQFEEKQDIKERLKLLPYSAAFTVILSLIIALVPDSNMFYNNRFQGIWNYANSYGLLLLIGLFVHLNKEEYKLKDYFVFPLLLIGIVLTNSRAIIILTVVAIIASIFTNKTHFKKTLIVLGAFLLTFCGAYFLFNMEKRVNTEMLGSSEFVVRELYYIDAINIIKDNPLGLGYDGWYYKQVEAQTGVYDTKYVHNSVLQVLLDVGIIPALAIFIMIGISFFNKKQTAFSRIIMILILGHSIIDLDLEYIFFVLILMMMVDYKSLELDVKKLKWLYITPLSILGFWYFIVFLGDGEFALKNYKEAVSIIPFHTEAIQEVLYSEITAEEQLEYANKVLKYNKIVSGAYEALSNELIKKGDYIEAQKLLETRLGYNKYNMNDYYMYAAFLKEGIDYYIGLKQTENEKILADEMLQIEDKITSVLEKTNPLSYKTIHAPEIEVDSTIQAFLSYAKKLEESLEITSP
jgi:hypothetical protein